MDSLIETVYVTLSLLVLFLVPVVLFIIYLVKRNGLYVSANCWFCNTWTKVSYADRNSFCCPTCQQYNGFDEDGNYNKVIEAQYDIRLNKYNNKLQKSTSVTNGLCSYCNNNQQLKICQLADFVPLNENNYDVEVEHFEKQLEKAYKLCKKCDKVLKITIEKQRAWIFGNRLKSIQKKIPVSLKSNKVLQKAIKRNKSIFLNFIELTLIISCMLIFCQALDIEIDYPITKFNTYMSNIFIPYDVFLRDINSIVTNTSMSINCSLNELNSYLPNYIILNYSNILPCVGLLFQLILVIWDDQIFWWKANQLLGWILLVISSVIAIEEFYSTYIKLLQAFCSTIIFCGLLSASKSKKLKLSPAKKFEFKKFVKNSEQNDCSDVDEEVSEDSNSSVYSKNSKRSCNNFKSYQHLNTSASDHSLPTISQSCLFQNKVQNTANLNHSFTTARSIKTASTLNKSVKTNSDLNSSSELNRSLDNLHLSTTKPQVCTSPVFSVRTINRPILSPSKLKNITQNSWTAGGFWKHDITSFPVSSEFTNLSRSSSQTSGFVSNNDPITINTNPFSSLPPSREPSVCGDLERNSILSEPPYHFQPINSNGVDSHQAKNSFINHTPQLSKFSSSPNSNRIYYRADNNLFYPILNQNNMLFIQPGNISHNFENSFSNLSLKNFNMGISGIKSPPLFGKPPEVSGLFKNLPGIATQSYTFKARHC